MNYKESWRAKYELNTDKSIKSKGYHLEEQIMLPAVGSNEWSHFDAFISGHEIKQSISRKQ